MKLRMGYSYKFNMDDLKNICTTKTTIFDSHFDRRVTNIMNIVSLDILFLYPVTLRSV